MEQHNRDFKGVWIPKDIWLSRELSVTEKLLFVEINSLDNERGCFASNGYFSKFFGISDRQIRRYVSTLKDKGYISVKIVGENQRTIRVTGKYAQANKAQVRNMQMQRDHLVRKLRGGHTHTR